MWILLFITLIAGDVYSTVKLEEYPTREECESERDRIMAEMVKSYSGEENPGQSSFAMVCRPANNQPKDHA